MNTNKNNSNEAVNVVNPFVRRAVEKLSGISVNLVSKGESKILEIKNGVMMWPNFSGFSYSSFDKKRTPDQFGKYQRNFKLVVPAEVAEHLEAEGLRIQTIETNMPDYPILHLIKVIVRIDHPESYNEVGSFPSKVYLVTNLNGQNNAVLLKDDYVSKLDGRTSENGTHFVLDHFNCVIRCRRSDSMGPKQNYIAYLSNIFAYGTENSTYADPAEAQYARDAVVLCDAPEEETLAS